VSEYQYYEFVAVDRPLDALQLDTLRALSTRARITPTSFVNTYQWGDFRGDPRALMEKFFDAFLYLANWGTRRVMIRLPGRLLSLDTAQRYCVGHSAAAWAAGEHVILDVGSEDEDGGDWDETAEDSLASIIPARAELASGDLRVLYLAWLLTAQSGEIDDDEVEPPVPAGLRTPTAPLRSLADFLRLDEDLLAVAAEASAEPGADHGTPADAARWVEGLPVADKDALILRILQGDDAHLRVELLRRFRGEPAADAAASGGRTAAQLLATADARRHERERVAEQRRTEERARRERAAAAAREQRLESLAREEEAAWRRVGTLIETKKPREYDEAVQLRTDLQAVGARNGQPGVFEQRCHELRQQHQRKPSLLARLDRAGLAATQGDS